MVIKDYNLNKEINKKSKNIGNLDDYCFVGVDPGNTVALAFINLKGELVKTWSKRNPKKDEIVNEILNTCKPLIFVTDVSKVPELVQNLASKFLVDVWKPKKDLNLNFKKRLVKENFEGNFDQHIIDALAAVFYYYITNKNKINYLLNKFGDKIVDIYKYGFIREVKEVDKNKNSGSEGTKIKENIEDILSNKVIYELKKSIYFKDKYITKLKLENKHLKSKLNKFKRKLSRGLNYEKNRLEKKYKTYISELKEEILRKNEKIQKFADILKKLNNGEYIILEPWNKYKYNKLSFIKVEDLNKINNNELKKFKKLVKSDQIEEFYEFGDIIIANKREVENALINKEDEIKKIKEFIKIYQERRKRDFL